MSENKRKDIGAIWVKSGQYGDYLSIQIEINGQKHNFVAYPNKYKEAGDKKPDYRIPEPKQVTTLEEKLGAYKQASAALQPSKPAVFITEEELPF